jgi:hypothetical protein
VLVLGSDIFGDMFESVHGSVSLLIVATVKDMTLQFGAVAGELGGGWKSLWPICAITTTKSLTATVRDFSEVPVVTLMERK